jgi:putative acetyltransferase
MAASCARSDDRDRADDAVVRRSITAKLISTMIDSVLIRHETPGDIELVRAVNEAAFGRPSEADLVDALRERARPHVSLVAERNGAIVGHIMFSPATLARSHDLHVMALGPMAVMPAHQRIGIGSLLVRKGLETCTGLGAAAVIVLGHPAYYPRFGFAPSVRFGIRSEYDVPDEVFMAMELVPGALAETGGIVHYHEAFAGL